MADLLRDAGWGAAVTVVLSILPFSPLAGGAVAAHRRDGGYLRGCGAGLLAGGIAAVPLGLLFVPALYVVQVMGFGVAASSLVFDVFLAVVAGLFLSYTVGLSGVGGVIGVWARRHTEWDLDPGRWV
jgi:hypothetical protein